MELQPTHVEYRLAEQVAWITLADPDRGNALTQESADELLAALYRAEDDRARVVVLRSEGWAFCVGGDLRAFADAEAPGTYVDGLADRLHRVVHKLHDMDAIVLSVVHGPAAGAGFPLALSADMVLASVGATFTLGYAKLGFTPDGGASLLVRSLGLHRAMRLALLSETIDAQEAYDLGLVTHLVSDPVSEVDALAARLAAGPRGALATTKRLLRQALVDADVGPALQREQCAVADAAASVDGREGVRAFLARRPATFA